MPSGVRSIQQVRRGRPPRDPLEALRARTWYWHVKCVSGLTDYRLNERFSHLAAPRNPDDELKMTEKEPRKVFERIRRVGIVPRDNSTKGLISCMNRDEICRGTAATFRSMFWDLLRAPNISIQRIKRLIQWQAWTLEISRPSLEEAWGTKRTFTSVGLSDEYVNGIEMITRLGSLDSAALLGLLYKEALYYGEIDFAQIVKDGFMKTMMERLEALRTSSNKPNIVRHQKTFERDGYELFNTAMNRVIFPAKETSLLGEHAEVTYAWS